MNKQTIDQDYIPGHVEILIKFRFNYYSDHMSFNISLGSIINNDNNNNINEKKNLLGKRIT